MMLAEKRAKEGVKLLPNPKKICLYLNNLKNLCIRISKDDGYNKYFKFK
jgi:hypothetical protein